MIVIDKDNKNLVIPNGLGNINRDYQEGYEAGYQESFDEGKAEGLAEGRAEGLAEGKAIGIEEGKQIQKDLLETITITENGTYNKEDGYNQVVVDVPDLNGSYDEGYADGEAAGVENAGAIIAETARVLDITENGSYLSKYSDPIYPDVIPEGNLIKTVNVNVVPKISVEDTGLKFAYSTFTEVPEWADFEGITDVNYMFNNCGSLTTIPEIDTSNVTAMNNMFSYCKSLQTIPLLNTSNVTNMESCFEGCENLTTIPQLNTSNVSDLRNLFYECRKLISIPPLIANKLSSNNWSGLFFFTQMDNLTDFGGLIGLKISLDNDYTFYRCPNLTYESCINILNGLYDFTGNGETPTGDQGQLKVHQNFLDLIGDEISIGVNKGWTITA